jgi:threonine dehydrogenase-like Zn-dependent dehydrogenase
MWLKRRGVGDIVAVDISEERLERARQLGAAHTLVAGRDDLRAELTRLHGEARSVVGPAVGTDIFFDFAGAPQVVTDIIDLAKQRATLLMVAIHPQPVPVSLEMLVVKELSLVGSCGYPDEYPEVIADLASMDDEADSLISHRLGFDRFHEALETARAGGSGKVMVEFSRT